jgi:2-polyprenyl-6-methoxyphenol hydroxylase-like FAD-dependent oxidoreductase
MLDLLIVGGGPTGLFLAAEAARWGLSFRLIEKEIHPTVQSRALALQPRTLEIFDHLGILAPFLDLATPIRVFRQELPDRNLVTLHFDHLDSPHPYILSLEQWKTEKILKDHLTTYQGQKEEGVELISWQEHPDHIVAFCHHLKTGKKETVKARWLVGCDGAHSQVRKLLHLPFSGTAFPLALSLADVHITWDFPHDTLIVFPNAKGLFVAIPMPGEGRYRLVFEPPNIKDRDLEMHGEIKENLLKPSLEEIQDLVKERVSPQVEVRDPTWLASFQIHSRLVQTYQQGRVYLAGDAAHIHSPAGGQGMNSGLQDAYNLVWKLALGDAAVLATYTLERRSWGEKLLKATKLFTHLATLKNPLACKIRNMWLHLAAPWLEAPMTKAISQIGIRYPESPIVQDAMFWKKEPRAGLRSPNTELNQGDLYSLLRRHPKQFHLLVFSPNPLQVDLPCPLLHITQVTHPKALVNYNVKQESYYLIRPDQHIGYRNHKFDPSSLKNYLSHFTL